VTRLNFFVQYVIKIFVKISHVSFKIVIKMIDSNNIFTKNSIIKKSKIVKQKDVILKIRLSL